MFCQLCLRGAFLWNRNRV